MIEKLKEKIVGVPTPMLVVGAILLLYAVWVLAGIINATKLLLGTLEPGMFVAAFPLNGIMAVFAAYYMVNAVWNKSEAAAKRATVAARVGIGICVIVLFAVAQQIIAPTPIDRGNPLLALLMNILTIVLYGATYFVLRSEKTLEAFKVNPGDGWEIPMLDKLCGVDRFKNLGSPFDSPTSPSTDMGNSEDAGKIGRKLGSKEKPMPNRKAKNFQSVVTRLKVIGGLVKIVSVLGGALLFGVFGLGFGDSRTVGLLVGSLMGALIGICLGSLLVVFLDWMREMLMLQADLARKESQKNDEPGMPNEHEEIDSET